MDSDHKLAVAFIIFLTIVGSIGIYFDYAKDRDKENTRRTMYENWDKFSDSEKIILLKQ